MSRENNDREEASVHLCHLIKSDILTELLQTALTKVVSWIFGAARVSISFTTRLAVSWKLEDEVPVSADSFICCFGQRTLVPRSEAGQEVPVNIAQRI